MIVRVKQWFKQVLKAGLTQLGLQITRLPRQAQIPAAAMQEADTVPAAPSLYMDAAMIIAAQAAGVYIGDYAEAQWEEVGIAKRAVENLYLDDLRTDSVILEVGPGTGRYVRYMLTFAPRGAAHLFELDPYWKNFLSQFFSTDNRVQLHSTDGWTYKDIPNNSVDIYCAHGVFVYTKPMQTYANLQEAVRVVKSGGIIVFDFFDLDESEQVMTFIETNAFPESQHWSLDSLSFLVHFMAQHQCQLEKTYQNKCHNYHSTYAVFRKQGALA